LTIAALEPGVVIQQTCSGGRVLHSSAGNALTLIGIALTGGASAGPGGGALVNGNATLSDCQIYGNSAASGGGLSVTGDAELSRCTVQSNTALVRGAGAQVGGHLTLSETEVVENAIRNLVTTMYGPIYAPGQGAGIHAGSVTARNTTIAGNALAGCSQYLVSDIETMSYGAGITSTGAVSLVNTTLTGNSAPSCAGIKGFFPALGVGVHASSLELDHATIADNDGGPTLRVGRIVAHRSVATATSLAYGGLCYESGAVESSYNWFSDATCMLSGVGDEQSEAHFALEPLADNGGFVRTRALGSGSVLVDRIPAEICPIAADARGVARPQGDGCDVGAVEGAD
jgi:hypothetical protein